MRDIFTILVVGCIGANAAVNHYDLLGRRGSEMNSPMVYKDIDYTKLKKNEQQKESTPPGVRALQRTGMPSNVSAIEGIHQTLYFDNDSDPNGAKIYYLKKYYTNGSNDGGEWFCHFKQPWNHHRREFSDYLNSLNSVFISTYEQTASSSNFFYGNSTNISSNIYTVSSSSYSFNNNVHPSPYDDGHNITYVPMTNVLNKSGRKTVNWINNYPRSTDYGTISDVGVYVVGNGFPAKLDSKSVPYIPYTATFNMNPSPEEEMIVSRMYKTISETSKRSVIYVGKDLPTSPASRVPQVYIGVHQSTGYSSTYYSDARDLDNYIYDNRTIEIAAAGNYVGGSYGTTYLSSVAHAANAITVGAVDPTSEWLAPYTSTHNPSYDADKPEVYNFSHFYFTPGKKRTYKTPFNPSYQGVFLPYYDGTEMAAAYTASMVSDLLAINSFYRWHPEVVKALLLTSSQYDLVYPNRQAPHYRALVFDYDSDDDQYSYSHYSRFWNGSMSKLKTRTVNGKPEIWFSVKTTQANANEDKLYTAAISWLSSGTDIATLGRVPQDFDLYVYESTNGNINSVNLNKPSYAHSCTGSNPYEKISFPSRSPYLIFRIALDREDDGSENKGQVVLGFDLAMLLDDWLPASLR